MRETGDEFARDCDGAVVIVQDFGIKARLIEEAVLVQRVLLLRDLVLLECLRRLPQKTKAIPEVRPHISVVGTPRDRFLVMLNGVGPVLVIVISISQSARRLGGSKI